MRALLGGASVEMGCAETADLQAAARLLPPGSDICIALAPHEGWEGLFPAARAVHEAGLNPVPHLPARRIADRAQLAEFARRLVGECGVTRLMLIAGDVAAPLGEFASTLPVLESGELAAAGVRSLCVAGHPEGHAHMTPGEQRQFEARKYHLAREQGQELTFVTQMCFESAPILAWERQLRSRGINAPVRAGIAGPADIQTLRQFAQIYGTGASAHVLDQGDPGPEKLPGQIATAQAEGSARFEAVHLFSFGRFLECCKWLAALRDGNGGVRP